MLSLTHSRNIRMNFSVSNIISQAWQLWKSHVVFTWMVLGVIFAVNIVFGILDPKGESILVSLLSILVTLFFELGAIALILKLVRTGQEGQIQEIISQKEIYPQALLGNIIYYIMMMVGFVLLIIPGIYVAVRFMFLPYVFVDQKLGWQEALKEASRLSEGRRWDLFGFSVVLILLNLVGVLLLLVGLLITIPVSMIATTMMYEFLKKEKDGVKEEVKAEEVKEAVIDSEGAQTRGEVIEAPAATPEPAA